MVQKKENIWIFQNKKGHGSTDLIRENRRYFKWKNNTFNMDGL